ncbi:CAP domain-containing protein [Bacillus sp. 03113]|uniref:CAP domain-containing protein n=1 Tax=Bacillus sp. 03113 TaxID=2578211 RepID=UPI0015E8ABC8|nr:CAP domain-containing protein [Bacillus sp. 03113]
MKRFLLLIVIIGSLWAIFGSHVNQADYGQTWDKATSEIKNIKENEELQGAWDSFNTKLQFLLGELNNTIEQLPKENNGKSDAVEKPQLKEPENQVFSVHNLEFGNTKDEVERLVGAPKRSSENEYGVKWYAYHENYQNYMMVAYNAQNKVAGFYTNQDLLASKNGIKLGSSKDDVLVKLGQPLTQIQKGFVFYQFDKNRDYDVFLIDNTYVTIFYDKHKNNTVTAIQLISKELEQNKKSFYTTGSEKLKEGFEFQLFDLTNASRVNHGLRVLTWDDHVKETARKHSNDMAENHYFNHTNLKGQSPFDRMQEDQVVFKMAGENLAYGQFSSIFAHEGLMNSLGHRENILQKGYKYLGVGVTFNSQSQPYYTENYYAD